MAKNQRTNFNRPGSSAPSVSINLVRVKSAKNLPAWLSWRAKSHTMRLRRVPSHESSANLVRSGTKQPRRNTLSAEDKARHFHACKFCAGSPWIFLRSAFDPLWIFSDSPADHLINRPPTSPCGFRLLANSLERPLQRARSSGPGLCRARRQPLKFPISRKWMPQWASMAPAFCVLRFENRRRQSSGFLARFRRTASIAFNRFSL